MKVGANIKPDSEHPIAIYLTPQEARNFAVFLKAANRELLNQSPPRFIGENDDSVKMLQGVEYGLQHIGEAK